MLNKGLLLKILGLCVFSFSHAVMAIDENGLYTRQDVLEEYAKGLDYLDDKVFIYQVDLSGNGYQDLLLTTSNNTYADLNRFGLRAFVIYPRLATSTENYLSAANIPLYVSDEIGISAAFSTPQVILKSYGTPHKNSSTPEYYYWMDSEYKMHTNNRSGVAGEIYIDMNVDIEHKIKESFVGKVRLSQLLKKMLTVGDILPAQLKATKQTYKDSMGSKISRSSSKQIVNGQLLNSTRYEYEVEGGSTYLGDFVGSKGVFYPNGIDNAAVFFNALVQTKGVLKNGDNGRLKWKYYFALAPEWAIAHPETAVKIKLLSESCLPREVCEPTNTEKVTIP
tara:strand:- start:49 stop:1056 length:1008 start_codon:yes stop_codon:yes gene_type:complete